MNHGGISQELVKIFINKNTGNKKLSVTLRVSNPHDYVNHMFKRS
jgi:hypothetical protein